MKVNTFNLLLVALMIALIVILSFILIGLRSEGAECIANPITFCAESLSQSAGAPVSCTCTAQSIGNSQLLFFDSEGHISIENP